jgi:hypothetical protein
MIVKAAKKCNHPISEVADYLPPAAASYMMWGIDAGRFVGPAGIAYKVYSTFRGCMQVTNGRLVVSCAGTGLICGLAFVPGPQQVPYAMICQQLIMLTYKAQCVKPN